MHVYVYIIHMWLYVCILFIYVFIQTIKDCISDCFITNVLSLSIDDHEG